MKKALCTVLVFLFGQPVFADVYHYVDESGKRVYVDMPSKIPPQFRDNVTRVKDRAQPIGVVSDLVAPASSEEIQTKEDAQSRIKQLEGYMSQLKTPVQIKGNSVLVPVALVYGNSRKTLNLLLDTGASSTVVHSDAVASLRVDARPAGAARVAGGGVIQTHSVNFNRMEVGPYKLNNVSTNVIENEDDNTPYDGLLGMNFLRSVKYDVDFDQKMIIWEPDNYQRAVVDIQRLNDFIQQVESNTLGTVNE